MRKGLPLLTLSCTIILTCEGESRQLAEMVDGMFGQFREVNLQSVWEDVQSRKTVSFSVVRDTAQFLVVNLAWITASLLLWRGPKVTENRRAGETETLDSLQDRTYYDVIDTSRLSNFFMNPSKVARNLFVCSSLFLMTFFFWFLPSLLWKKPLAVERGQAEERLTELSERVTGVYQSLAESGLADIYNRVLCPTCIAQIVIINSMVYLAQMTFWSTTSLLPSTLPFG